MIKPQWVLLVALIILSSECPSVPPDQGSRSTAAGEVSSDTSGPEGNAESTAEEGPPLPTIKRLALRARIGLLEGGPEDWFGDIQSIAVDDFKRVYVADTYAHDVRVFDSLGIYLRTIGRDGRGPGEFLWPTGLAWQNASTLWVFDQGNVRYSVFDTSGAHLRDERRPPLGTLGPWWHGSFENGLLVEPHIGGSRSLLALNPGSPGSQPQDTFPYPLAGIPLDEWNPSYWVRTGETVRRTKIPFTEGYEWVLDGNGGVWIGDTKRYHLVRRTLTGDTVLVVNHDRPLTPVSASERRSAIEALGATRAEFDLSVIPDHKPVFRLIVPTHDGGIWLVREGEGTDWFVDVLDPSGRIVATAELPVEPDIAILPVVQNGDLWIVAKGAADVRFVVRYSLT